MSQLILGIAASANSESGTPLGWQAAIDSGDLVEIEAWYAANTGHLAEGFDAGDLWHDPALPTDDAVQIDATWLSTNEGVNVVDNGDGSWTVTGLHCKYLTTEVNDLTLNHCLVDREGDIPGHGLQINNTDGSNVDVTVTGIVLNYCTLDGGFGVMSLPIDDEDAWGNAVAWFPISSIGPDAVTFNHCEITGYGTGWQMYFGATSNYSYVHDLDIDTRVGADPHNTSHSIRGQHCKVYRGYFADGTSSNISLYAENSPYTNIDLTENVFSRSTSVMPAAYEVNFPGSYPGSGISAIAPGYVRILHNNRFEDGEVSTLELFTEYNNNQLLDGTPLWGGPTDSIPGQPTIKVGYDAGNVFGGSETILTGVYTPSPSSTQIAFYAIRNNAHGTTPAPAISDSESSTWTLFTGGDPAYQNAGTGAADSDRGMSIRLWKNETSSSEQDFRSITVDPYPASTAQGSPALMVVELTGITGLTLQQALVSNLDGDSAITSLSASLGSAATSGNLCMAFVAWRTETQSPLTVPAGWNVLGNLPPVNIYDHIGWLALWRTDFTGTGLTITGFPGGVEVAGMFIAEFNT